ncbi:MAG: hypothetical protein MSA13_02925 [Prevotella sp.]|nr:hypothetical protein [Prevotella sp.]
MKKLLILIMGAIILSSCGTTSSGAYSGAMLGGIVGSCIGGISGGPRGSDIGTLVGMATGAMAGAAIGNAAETQQREAYYAQQSGRSRSYTDDVAYSDRSGRSEQPIYDDVINMAPSSVSVQQLQAVKYDTDIVIANVRFINSDNTQHISQGELVKIAFEIRNVSGRTLHNIVPVVRETTANKRLIVSPSTMIEALDAHKAIRYTSYVSAQENLKTGTAHFHVSVMAGGAVVSNTVEFDIPLN